MLVIRFTAYSSVQVVLSLVVNVLVLLPAHVGRTFAWRRSLSYAPIWKDVPDCTIPLEDWLGGIPVLTEEYKLLQLVMLRVFEDFVFFVTVGAIWVDWAWNVAALSRIHTVLFNQSKADEACVKVRLLLFLLMFLNPIKICFSELLSGITYCLFMISCLILLSANWDVSSNEFSAIKFS